MTNLYKIRTMAVASIALAAISCSDYDTYNTVPTDSNVAATKTMYQNISENANLRNFAAIVNKANYGAVLNSPQCYTLWAPLDGTYDATSILAMDSTNIVDKFINMHLAQFSYPVSGIVNKRIITINDKHHTFTEGTFDELDIQEANIPSTNGLIHTINGMSAYHPNIYEYMDEVEGCDSFKNHIQAYDIPYIDTHKSVEGPMLNGQQTYLDTVWAKRNTVIGQILNADIEDEDSSFTVLFPTNEAWVKAYDRISPLFMYIPTTNYMDINKLGDKATASSLSATTGKADLPVQLDATLYRDSLPKLHVMRNLAFSNSHQQNSPLLTGQYGSTDTLLTTNLTHITNVGEVLGHCSELLPMSNGYVRTIDSLCFKPWETFEVIRTYTNPERTLGLKDNASYTKNTYGKDSLISKHIDMFSELPDFIKSMILPKDERFFSYISVDSVNFSSSSAKPELDFALRDVLSDKYHIYVVLVPSQLKDPWRPLAEGTTDVKNLYLRFDMSYTDENNTQQYKRINVSGAKVSDDILVKNDGKFHVVELEFTFPICYYGLDAYPTLFMSLTQKFSSTALRKKYEQELRVAGVFLVPEGAYDYVQSLKF